jgi:hypothetical protein
MKVASIHLTNFKRFGDLRIEMRNSLTEDVADQFLILGDNGTGKTTVLQAVALCLSLACKQTRSVKDFSWPGWLPARYERWGKPSVELEVHFTKDEIEATHEAARRWFESSKETHSGKGFISPGKSESVRLKLDGERSAGGPSRDALSEDLLQFRGRWYASKLLETDPGARDLFVRLPGVFWFDQFRTLATTPAPSADQSETNGADHGTYEVGVARFRQHLNRWQPSHLVRKPDQRDYLQDLENSYKRIFPGRSFDPPEPMYRGGIPSPKDYYFMINDGNRNYDIEEMSAGEQAVFPMLYEFVRQQIRNSVVLIDEIDLNLHPSVAQWLLSALPALGPGCQFLLTTHSEAISSVVSSYQIHRLPGGRLCL